MKVIFIFPNGWDIDKNFGHHRLKQSVLNKQQDLESSFGLCLKLADIVFLQQAIDLKSQGFRATGPVRGNKTRDRIINEKKKMSEAISTIILLNFMH